MGLIMFDACVLAYDCCHAFVCLVQTEIPVITDSLELRQHLI